MLFDTDILIWFLRGNPKAAKAIDQTQSRNVSVVAYMELLQGAKNKSEIKAIRTFLTDLGFAVLPLTENIGHRAAVYMEEYCLKVNMCLADALLAASAVEYNLTLYTANTRHYNPVKELEIKQFKP